MLECAITPAPHVLTPHVNSNPPGRLTLLRNRVLTRHFTGRLPRPGAAQMQIRSKLHPSYVQYVMASNCESTSPMRLSLARIDHSHEGEEGGGSKMIRGNAGLAVEGAENTRAQRH